LNLRYRFNPSGHLGISGRRRQGQSESEIAWLPPATVICVSKSLLNCPSRRPWISVDTTIVGPFTIDEKGGYVRLKIEIKNVGLSMADDVRIFPVIYPDKIDNISIEEIQETRCRKPRNKSSHGSLAFTLFPGQSKIEIDAPGLTSEDIQHIRVSDRKKISPAIVICVSYVASITRRIYFSTALFGLYERTSVGSDQIVPVLLGDIPVQPERLYLMPFGSFAE
jgi:hypothetical protein